MKQHVYLGIIFNNKLNNEGNNEDCLNFVNEKVISILSEFELKIITNVEVLTNSDIADCVENFIKQNDFVIIVISERNRTVLSEINENLAKVLNQKVCNRRVLKDSVSLLEYAKVLWEKEDEEEILIYYQGLFITFYDSLESVLATKIVPFIQKRWKINELKRIILLEKESNIDLLPKLNVSNFKLSVIKEVDCWKVSISSANIKELLSIEYLLKNIFESNVLKVENECKSEEIYNYNFSYVKHSIEIIEKCLKIYGPENILIAFNGGKDCMVLLHITVAVLKRNYPNKNFKLLSLYVQHTDPFKELDEFVEQCTQFYNLNLLKFNGKIKDALSFTLTKNPNLKACLMGTRRNDPFASELNFFEMTDPDWPQIMRVSPLLDWHYSNVWDYILDLKVPYCSLYDEGYTSLGGISNTKPNPSLRYKDPIKGSNNFLPAFKLLDATQERNGR